MRCNSSFPKVCRDILLILLPLIIFPSVLCKYRYSACNNASTFKEGSAYSTNLNGLLDDLSRNAPQSSGFNTSSRGQSPNKVYGLLQCIGNVSSANCLNCSEQATSTSNELCGNDIGAEVWMDDCFMRYDNSNFISTLDTHFVGLVNVNNVTSNLQSFISTTAGLLTNLSNQAYIAANKFLGAGSASYATSNRVYGLTQCWRDLSVTDCRSCLFQAKQYLQQCCSTKQGAQVYSGSCTVRYEIYPFLESHGNLTASPSPSPQPSSPQPNSSPPVAPSSTNSTVRGKSKKSSKTLPIILGIVVGTVLVILILLLAMRKRLKSAIFGEPTRTTSHGEGLLHQERDFIFSLEELAEGTENFDDKNKLGEGGFGAVYKGMTKDGRQIAVKKLSAKSRQGKEEFMNEVKLVANVQHRNLVKLYGCCVEGDERLIVYEYLPNKSLDTFLFDPEKRGVLNWEKMYNLIVGIARGLLYLHEGSQVKIIHRDIKASNILLDDKLNPKIADFGLARLFDEEETHVHTRVAGTYGYMAPEYAMRGQLSAKADVYSYGVLLLEILSGKKSLDTHLSQETQNLLEWAWRLYKAGNILSIVDSAVSESCQEEQALRCINTGFLCIQADPILRPPMSNVMMMISSSSVTLPIPTKPAFVDSSKKDVSESSGSGVKGVEKGTASGITSSSASGVPSVNEASISAVDSR